MKLSDYIQQLDTKAKQTVNDIESGAVGTQSYTQPVISELPQNDTKTLSSFIEEQGISTAINPEQVNPSTGEIRPYYANGSSSENPYQTALS